MAKLRVLSGQEVVAIICRHGFTQVRRKGSHIALQRSTITVIVPDHKEVSPGTLRSIIRQSQLPRELFELQ